MPLAMVLFWVAFVGVVTAKIHADHNAPSPARPDGERIVAERCTRSDVGTDDHRERLDNLRGTMAARPPSSNTTGADECGGCR